MSEVSALERGLDELLARACRRPYETQSGQVVRCGSRLKSECPGCSSIHVGDWRAIIRSGIYGAGPEYRFFLLTLTAPSFGQVHRVPRPGIARVMCRCGTAHDSARRAGALRPALEEIPEGFDVAGSPEAD